MTQSQPSPSENRADLSRLLGIQLLPPGSTGPKRVAALRASHGKPRTPGRSRRSATTRLSMAANPLRRAQVALAPRPLARNDVEAARALREWLDLACGGR